MKIKSLILTLFLLTTSFMGIFTMVQRASAQPLLLDDVPVFDNAPVPDDYQLDVLSNDHAVVGVRPESGDDFDIEVYTDTTFGTLIENSTSVGDEVDFVVLDKTVWASPPNRGARVTSGSTSYVIEMENDVDNHVATDTWSGSMISYPVLDVGPPGSWDDTYVYYPSVFFDGITYHMWYSGKDDPVGTIRIGYATSLDGVKWTKNGANPVLDKGPSLWDDESVWAPTVLYDSMTSTYKMWYSGGDSSWRYRIGYATSPDGITWTKNAANPVLGLGSIGSWDDYRVYTPTVLYDGSTYHMWYTGGNSAENVKIGYATSPDGITWTKNAANPVLDKGPPGSWDNYYVFTPIVLYDGITYRMWYTGSDTINQRIGYATSPDGITWTKYGANPVVDIGPPGSWDDIFAYAPTVLYDGITSTYHVWYTGYDGTYIRLGYATSPDGINWKKIPSEVLDAFEITGLAAGTFYKIDLYVPANLDLDLFIFNTTGGKINAVAASTNAGIGVDESMSFIAPTIGDYLLVVTNEDGGTGSYTISFDNPPTITVYEPGGTSGQMYIQGDLITVTWNATDDYPLPAFPINITYGNLTIGWTTISTNEVNDGAYLWDTSGVPCPGTYWMNLSVYDSIGQEAYDWSNFSFDLVCDSPPIIEAWEPGGSLLQTYIQGDLITITWNATDDRPLPANPINITYGVPLSGWTTVSMNEVNDGAYLWDTSGVPCPGTYWMNLSVYDSIGQEAYDWSNFSFEIECDDPPTIEVWNPGGTPFQTYTQGDLITASWNATDNNPLPANPINISYGIPFSSWTTLSTNEVNDGTYLWDTSGVPCPGTYWMNLSVYDSIGQEAYDWSNFSFDLVCDNPPAIEAWEPGGSPLQTYTQGDQITVTWTASDNYPLPLNPINISYGVPLNGWTTLSTSESNDGTYLWDTVGVTCPGIYWMNLSVYDSIGQETFDWSNFSFEIECPSTYPPIIKNVEAEPDFQIEGQEVTISAEVTDEDTDVEDLTVHINIMKLDGAPLGNYSMTCDSTDKCTYSSNFDLEGIYTFTIWASDTDGNWDYATGIFVIEPEPQEYNWKPIIALIFALILLHIGILVSYRRPIRFTGVLGRDRVYTFLACILPFVIVEALIGIISLFTGLLNVPPIWGIGMIVDLIILIVGIISCAVIFMKGNIPKSYEEEVQRPPPAHPSLSLPSPPPPQTESVTPVQAVKLCSKCGQELEPEYIICPYCGVPA